MADEPQYYACVGLIEVMANPAVVAKQQSQSNTNYETTTKSINYDKQTGSYARGTVKESRTSGDYTNRAKVGYKDEYKSSSTVRVGDKRGYTEYYKQEKVTRVEYDGGNSCSGGGNGGKNCVSGGRYGGGAKVYKTYGGGKKYLY